MPLLTQENDSFLSFSRPSPSRLLLAALLLLHRDLPALGPAATGLRWSPIALDPAATGHAHPYGCNRLLGLHLSLTPTLGTWGGAPPLVPGPLHWRAAPHRADELDHHLRGRLPLLATASSSSLPTMTSRSATWCSKRTKDGHAMYLPGRR